MNIAYLSNFDFELLPETLAVFRQTFPHIALNLFDMTPAEQFRALETRKIDLGFVGLCPPAGTTGLQWESIAQHRTVVVLPAKHPLVSKRQVKLGELETMFFVGHVREDASGLSGLAQRNVPAGGLYTAGSAGCRVGPALMTFVAEGLGVTLAREHIKKLPHPGVAFRPLTPPVKSDYCIAWNRNNDSRALQQYIEIVKGLAADAH